MMTPDSFRDLVEAFLARSGTSATRFGREAVGDPNFVRDLRQGRAPSLKMAQRVLDWIKHQEEPGQEAAA